MLHEPTKLVLGRGEVYFDAFAAGTRTGVGERYLGNTLSFRIQRDLETQERMTSYGGVRVRLPDVTLSESHSVEITCDHVDMANVALWFGTTNTTTSRAQTDIEETFAVRRGLHYQLGKSVRPHLGLREVAQIEVEKAGAIVSPVGNYQSDGANGRIYIEPTSSVLTDGTSITVRFTLRARTDMMFTPMPAPMNGALRFVSFNEGVIGRPRIDYIFPFVSITPKGQIDMKGDQFQEWGFDANAFNLTPGTKQLYVSRAPQNAARTTVEQYVITQFGTLERAEVYDDLLDISVNQGWPHALQNPIFD